MEEIFRSQNCLLYESGKKSSLLDLVSQIESYELGVKQK